MTATTLTARGVTFAYVERGDPDGPLALVLHGFPDSPVGFSPLLDALADRGFHAVAPWLRGFAPTSLAPDASYHVGSLAADANALHEAFGADGDAVLIGHDWGAYATYPALAVAPSRWRRAVAMAVPPAGAMVRAMATYAQLQRSWYMWLFTTPIGAAAVSADGFAFVTRLWAQWSPGLAPGAADHAIAAAVACIEEPAHLEAALCYYRSMFLAGPEDPQAAAAQALAFSVPAVPVLYLHGDDDGCIGVEEIGDPTEFLCAGSSYVRVPGAGHFLHLERPDEVTRETLSFLGR